MSSENKGATVEENLAALEKISAQMSDPNVSLEDSFNLYIEGLKRINECDKAITSVKQRVEKVNEDGTIDGFDYTKGTETAE